MTPAVITGVAALTGAGDAAALTAAVLDEVPASARAVVEPFPAGLPEGSAPVVRVATPKGEVLGGLKRPFPDRLCLLAIGVVDQALRDAGLTAAQLTPARTGVVINTCFCANATVDKYLRTLLTAGPDQVSPIAFARTVANAVLGELTRRHALLGPGVVIVGSTSLGYAADLIADGRADVVIAVGIDTISEYAPWVYSEAGMLGEGMMLGEAAAAIVLERAEHAWRRGNSAAVQVAGYAAGFCPDAIRRLTDFSAQSIEDTMVAALDHAGFRADAVDTVMSLQNGHQGLAVAESIAIEAALAGKARRVAPKLAIGETFGSSELAAAIVANALVSSGASRVALVNAGQSGGALSCCVLARAEAGR